MLLRLQCPNTEIPNWVLKYSKSDLGPGPRWRRRGVVRCGQMWQWRSCHWRLHQDQMEDGRRKKIWVLTHIGQDGYCPLQPKISVDVTPKPGCVLFGPRTWAPDPGRSGEKLLHSLPSHLGIWPLKQKSPVFCHPQLLSADGSGLVLVKLSCRHCLWPPVSLPPVTRT